MEVGSYITNSVFLHGFTEKGELIVGYKKGTSEDEFFGTRILPIEHTDKNWMLYSRVFISDNSPLSKWKGKKIRLCKATKNGGISFKGYTIILIAASKHHIVFEVLNYTFKSIVENAILEGAYGDSTKNEILDQIMEGSINGEIPMKRVIFDEEYADPTIWKLAE